MLIVKALVLLVIVPHYWEGCANVIIDKDKKWVAKLIPSIVLAYSVDIEVGDMGGEETSLFPCKPGELFARAGYLVRILSLVLLLLNGNPY